LEQILEGTIEMYNVAAESKSKQRVRGRQGQASRDNSQAKRFFVCGTLCGQKLNTR
jgi:hypothetical protein